VLRALPSSYIDVDEGTQAVVFAEIAACVFISRRVIANVRNGFKTDKRGLPAIAPETDCLLCGADCSGLAAVFMDDNLRLFSVRTEAGFVWDPARGTWSSIDSSRLATFGVY